MKDRRSGKANHEHRRCSGNTKPAASSADFGSKAKNIAKETNGVEKALSTRRPRARRGVAAPICGWIREGRSSTLAHSVASTTEESLEMMILRPPRYIMWALGAVLLVGGAVVAAVGRTVKPRLFAAGDTASPADADERSTSAPASTPSGVTPEAPTSRLKLQLPKVHLRLRSVGWPDADTTGDAVMNGTIASVALDLSLVEGSGGRGYHGEGTGRRNRCSDDYWLLADFDDGAVIMWQEPPGFRERQPLVPLGLCPGEHAVSGWGVAIPSPGSSGGGAAAGRDSCGPFVCSATPTSFVIHIGRPANNISATERVSSVAGGMEGSGDAGGDDRGVGSSGIGAYNGDKEACDGSERQPALPGRESQLKRGHGAGGLCRVCGHTLEEQEGRHDGQGFQFSLTSSVFPRGRKRLMLRTSMIATIAGGGSGHATSEGSGQYGQGDTAGQHEREIEWPIELREGDSPAAAAREFVAERLGLAVRPKGTAPEVVVGVAGASLPHGGELGQEHPQIAAQEVGGAASAAGERMVGWVTKQLETELAERQVRRSLKRAEAAQTMSTTGQLRVILGATVGATRHSGIDLHHPPHVGWLETDANTLDVTDPSDFTYMLGGEGLVDAFVAEHVWEHLSLPDAHRATRNCERHLRPGGRLRVAVPDPAWYSGSAGSSSILRDEENGFVGRGDNNTASPTQTEGSTSSDTEKAGIGGGGAGGNGGMGDSIGGESGDASEERDNRTDVTPKLDEVGRGGRTAMPAGIDLPGWLSEEMLTADARDRHLVQFTPELLANVCWSAGLIPFLLEGGGANEEEVVSCEQGAAASATKAAGEGDGEDVEVNDAARNYKEPGVSSGYRCQKAPTSLAWFPTAGEDDVEERQQNHLWGHIRRSAAGGDPRGAVSVVMDCVKPAVGADDIKDDHPESSEGGYVAGIQPAPHDAQDNRTNFHGSEGLTPPESEPSSSPPYSEPSQQRLPVLGNSLTNAETSKHLVKGDKTDAKNDLSVGAVAGITSGIGHSPGTDASVAGGVVAIGKGAAATDAPVAVNIVTGSYDKSTSIVVRPVANRPKDSSNIIVTNYNGQGRAFGGSGTGMGTTVSSCRGLMCDGGGQSNDAAGSGEGGFRRPSPPRRVSGNKNRDSANAVRPNTGQPDEHASGDDEGQSRRHSGTPNQPRAAFPSQESPSSSSSLSSSSTDKEAMKLRISDEMADSSGVVRGSSYDGKLSAPAGRAGGFILEAGLSVDQATGRYSVPRGGRLAILGGGDDEAPAHPSPSGVHDAGDRPSHAGSIDPGGEVTNAEAHRVGGARVAAALVRAGDEERTARGTGAREAKVRRSVHPPLRLNNGTLVLGERLGLRLSPLDPVTHEGFDGNGDDEGHAGGVGNIRHQSRRNGESLEEWATAARKNGRVDLPVPNPPEPSSREQRTRSENDIADNSSSSSGGGGSTNNNKDNPILLTVDDLKNARNRAYKALLASNVTGTLDMCRKILQEWPSDGATLLYQGAAMAQSGDWDNAWNRMERVLALSSGVEEIATVAASTAAGYSTTYADDRRGNSQSSARPADAAEPPGTATAAAVPLDITLAAAANLASFARARAPETLDPNAETFFLVDGLRGAAERDRVAFERENTSEKSAWLSSETSASDEHGKEEHGGGKAEESYKAERVDGYTDLLVMLAQALEGKGQLTSALRLYQRAVLLGGHRDPRALHGLGGLSRRLLEVERERMRRKSFVPSPPSLPTPDPPDLHGHHVLHRQTGTGATTTSTSETGFAASRKQRQQQRTSGCEWGITHPKSGQVFSPDDPVQVEFDLTLLDPALPSAGPLFEAVTLGNGAPGAGGLADLTGEGRRGGIALVGDGLGVVVCSYLEGYKAAHCLPRGQLRDIGPGWHLLTAEAYQLPSLRPLSCLADDEVGRDSNVEDSTRTVRFCVGDAATTCRAASLAEGGEYNNRTSNHTDTEEKGRSSTHQAREKKSSSPNDGDLVGVPEQQKIDSTTEPVFQGGKVEDAWREAPSAEAGDKPEEAEVELPFCFMTLALNAMPFITHHAPVFDEVGQILSKRAAADVVAAPNGSNNSTKTAGNPRGTSGNSLNPETSPTPTSPVPEPESFWEWHVVEGVAAGRANHDNPYSRRRIPDRYFDPGTGLSVDGTTQYLNGLAAGGAGANVPSSSRQQRVYVHRRCDEPPGIRRTPKRPAGTETGSNRSGRSTTTPTEIPGAGAGAHAETKGRKGRMNEPPRDGVGGGSEEAGAETESCLWRDKIQMVNYVAFTLERECLLVQIDADEMWTAEQLVRLRDVFLLERKGGGEDDGSSRGAAGSGGEQQPVSPGTGGLTESTGSVLNRDDQQQRHIPVRKSRECAYFDCHFFVGPDLVTVTEDGWGHSKTNEWLRAWVFRPRQSVWLQHAPPELARHDEAAGWKMLAGEQCIGRAETRERGLVFTHYAYVLEEQVRFKDEFYGHSEMTGTIQADAVAEWRALQGAVPPVLLTDHLTWLRIQGEAQDSRLLATLADRAPRGNFSRTRLPLISTVGTEYPGGEGGVGEEEQGDNAPGAAGIKYPLAEQDATVLGRGGGATFPLVPLEPFLQLAKQGNSDNTAGGLRRRAERSTQTAEATREGPQLTHDVNTLLKEHRWDDYNRLPRSRGGDQEERSGRTASMKQVSAAAADRCGFLHLVVDGVVFQVEAARPSGITRVWENVLPAMLGRLSEFEGTCLTLLVRGLAPPPAAIEEAFSRLPSDRFAVTHLPPYNPSFGFVADRLMLSWAVRNAGATAFVSTLHTHPFWATTPNVVRLLLVHDALPELFGWDMTSGEWLEKADAIAVASSVVAVSQHAAKGFLRLHPSPHAGNGANTTRGRDRTPAAAAASVRPVWAAHNGVDTTVFRPRAPSDETHGGFGSGSSNDNDGEHGNRGVDDEDDAFRRVAGLEPGTPYVLIVGSRHGYKNACAVFHAFGRAATPTAAGHQSAVSGVPALVLVGGGPVVPEELELLAEVSVWSHIGVGSDTTGDVDDRLLVAGYAGALALLHLSLAEGFGLTVLEAFACGCPVIATDIPPVREIAGLPDLEEARAAGAAEGKAPSAVPPDATLSTAAENSRPPGRSDGNYGGTPPWGQRADRYEGAASSLEGGLVLVENPASATQVWRAVRAVAAMGPERREAASEALVRRAKVFDSWQPLADTLIKAAVE